MELLILKIGKPRLVEAPAEIVRGGITEIVIPYTYQNINQKIHYKTDTGFDKTIDELENIFNEASFGGIITDLDETIWLFKQFFVVGQSNDFGASVYIKDVNEFTSKINTTIYQNLNGNIYHSWLVVLKNLNESIDEFYRYGAEDTDPHITFLKNVLIFLSYINIYTDSKTWNKLYKGID